MNDAGLSKYYYGSTYQHAELSTPIHMWEHETQPTVGGNYVNSVNGFFEDEQIFFPTNVPQHTQSDLPTVAVQEPSLSQASIKEPTTCNDSPTATSVALANIPFVQIHATHLEPPDKNYHNVFRRKAEVIKAEPIKSETADAAKERVNSTPTPPARNASCSSIDGKTNLEIENGNPNNHVASHTALPVIHKCSTCPFISLSQSGLSAHIASVHTGVPKQRYRSHISCPGCENAFYSYNSLDVHLREDHLMVAQDISSIMFALHQEKNLTDDTNSKVPENSQFENQSKSRIFIRNVNCLRAPQGEVVEPKTQLNENLLETTNNVFNLLDRTEVDTAFQKPDEPVQSKQKISIKSVNVLRDSAPIQQELDQTYNNYQETNNSCNNNVTHETDLIDCTNDNMETLDRPRRPKIYIKNVDILKEPMLMPRNLNLVNIQNMNFSFGTQNVDGEFENNTELLTTPADGFESNIQNLANMRADAYLFENSMNNTRGGAGNILNDDYLETFVNTANATNTNQNFTVDQSRFVTDLDMNFNYTDTTVSLPLVPEPTPPMTTSTTVPVTLSSTPDMDQLLVQQNIIESAIQKQKIFIKNVDILKAPQVHNESQSQHQRGTLHLRTVDELNLMNRNDVENLLAPNISALPNESGGDVQCNNITVPVLSDFGPDFPHSWSNEDYDLGEDLDCIITDSIDPLINISKAFAPTSETSKTNIEPGMHALSNNPVTLMPEIDSLTQMAEDILNENFTTIYNLPTEHNMQDNSKLEHTLNNSNIEPLTTHSNISMNVLPTSNIPPLVPVTSTTGNGDPMPASMSQDLSSIPVPPLVPCAPTMRPLTNKRDDKIKSSTVNSTSPDDGNLAAQTNNSDQNALYEKSGRIYVANNLHQDTGDSVSSQDFAGGTSVRGRPYGAKRTGITKLRKQNGNAIETQVGIKCSMNGCAFRFKVPETLEYHKRCHNSESNSTQAMICPECKSTEFNNWNSLHTHLWRTHQIDMELYRCPQCAFRTPIYSRLINTHSKIHSEERNYKCEQCGKAFKNTKQLKNHRRWHRNQGTHKTQQSASPIKDAAQLHRCEDCSAAFSHLKSLREHLCKNREEQLQCEFCQRQMSSKSSLKLHLLTHESEKRFKCVVCDYQANDHNAFRRHRMTHLEETMYSCPFCKSKFIQSCAYQRHIQQKHPKRAADVVYKCPHCVFTTINRSLLLVHQTKHEGVDPLPQQQQPNIPVSEEAEMAKEEDNAPSTDTQKSKIKVKSNLLLTHSSENLMDVSDDLLNSLLISQKTVNI